MQSSLDVGVVAGGRDGDGGAAAADDGRRAVAGSQAGFAAEVRAGAALAAGGVEANALWEMDGVLRFIETYPQLDPC